jgi:hypothetical protein
MSTVEEFRDWKPAEWFDNGFLRSIPSSAREIFCRTVRPVGSALSARIIQSIFSGISHPFDYTRAGGWMAELDAFRVGIAQDGII